MRCSKITSYIIGKFRKTSRQIALWGGGDSMRNSCFAYGDSRSCVCSDGTCLY